MYDEVFLTVFGPPSPDPESQWLDMFRTSRDAYLLDDPDTAPSAPASTIPALHDSWSARPPSPVPVPSPSVPSPSVVGESGAPPLLPAPTVTPILRQEATFQQVSPPSSIDATDLLIRTVAPPSPLVPTVEPGRAVSDPRPRMETGRAAPEPGPIAEPGRARRERKPNPKFIGEEWVTVASDGGFFQGYTRPYSPQARFIAALNWDSDDAIDPKYAFFDAAPDPFSGDMHHHPLAYQMKVQNADSPSLREILQLSDPDKKRLWFEAMDEELSALLEKGTFTKVIRSTATDKQSEIIGTTWVLKRKRRPDGTIIKLKARLVVRGDQQTQVANSVDDTYAPVVAWSTIRLMLTMAISNNLVTSQIDFRNAFVQSDLPSPIYVELPPGGYSKHPSNSGMILEVHKSLYGDVRAPKLWYRHLRVALEKIGFVVDEHDACLFTKAGCVFVVYVDDAILMSTSNKIIEETLNQLNAQGLDIQRMGTLSDYLGVQLKELDPLTHTAELSQPDLARRLIEVLGLTNGNPVTTPADRTLGKCLSDEPATGEFNYRSAVGIAMYLANNTRLNCAMAVHQCARFSANPRLPHEQALKRIGRYLLGNADKGLIIRASKQMKLDCYVDADFCGLFNYEDADDANSARSRSGYLLTLADIPILWSSKMQSAIALSTMESEYVALSSAMRALIPVKSILKTISSALDLPIAPDSGISTVWEDNKAALTLATTDPRRMTPRSKHIAIKYNWFRKHLKIGHIEIKHITSEMQKADILTKTLSRIKHEQARLLTMGW